VTFLTNFFFLSDVDLDLLLLTLDLTFLALFDLDLLTNFFFLADLDLDFVLRPTFILVDPVGVALVL